MLLRFKIKSTVWQRHFDYLGLYEGVQDGVYVKVQSNNNVSHWFGYALPVEDFFIIVTDHIDDEVITIDLTI